MTKSRYTMLQKKLQQLQTELTQVFTLPAETTSCSHQLISEGIEQRLDFLKNLLSAEIASSDHPPSKPPHHLLLVDQRLAELESAFRKWEDYCNSIYIHNNNVQADDHDDASVCSCTESFLNEEYGESSSQMDDVPEFGSSTVCELPAEGFYGAAVGGGGKEEAAPVEKVVVMKRDKLGGVWRWIKYCAKLVLYLLVGAILVVKFMSSTDYHQGSLTPT